MLIPSGIFWNNANGETPSVSVRFTVFWDFIKKIEELNLLRGGLYKNCNVLVLMSHADDFY